MITKPKAEKFRLSAAAGPGPAVAAAGPAAGPQDALARTFDTQGDGFGAAPFATAGAPAGPLADRPAGEGAGEDARPPAELALEAELEAIRQEGLTGRQLRNARRMAQKHNLKCSSDYDAVRQLRAMGINPLERGGMLELVLSETRLPADPQSGTAEPGGGARGGTTGTASGTALAPSAGMPLPRKMFAPPPPAPLSEEARAREILEMQRDIARRRRRRLGLLFVRLAIFILLPTLAAGWYYYRVATPLYATHSEFLIQKADGGGAAGGLGSLLAGTMLAGSQDSITVQGYLGSREAMLRLDAEEGFKDHFSQSWIDPVKRLPEGASNEDAYALYRKNVKIGFDPTEGLIKLEVIAADPETSARFSRALIRYAEEQVDHLTARLRDDQMQGAATIFAEAERKMQAAQERVLELQEKLGVLDPGAETGALMGQISGLEGELQQKRLELQAILDNPQPNQARVAGLSADIARIEQAVAALRGQLTQSAGSGASLARISGELRMAEVDLDTRLTMMTAALQQLESARIEANRQVRYLAVGVQPVAPDRPTYPRRFEDTLLALLIFSGIYLMISLTASILREQVSA